jgi:hypothetical protein
MGWLRTSVGVALIVAPGVPMRIAGNGEPSGSSLLLMRTIGVRDLVLGLGTVAATTTEGDDEATRWMLATLASDTLDTVVSLWAIPFIGKRDAVAAAGLAFTFVCGDLLALRRRHEALAD